MGERLMGADRGNPRGHFENLDFFEFHRDVLKASGYSAAGWVHRELGNVPEEFLSRARALVEQSAAHAGPAGWGWKDPRSTLFLEFWRKLSPGANYAFIYRAPWEVADSVFRRGTDQDQHFRLVWGCGHLAAVLIPLMVQTASDDALGAFAAVPEFLFKG